MIDTEDLEQMLVEIATGKESTLHTPEADVMRAKLQAECDAIVAAGYGIEIPHEIPDVDSAPKTLARRETIHQAADAHYKPLFLTVMTAFLRGKKAYKSGGVDRAVKAIRASLEETLPPVLLKTMVAGGNAGLGMLRKMRTAEEFRALKPQVLIKFDAKTQAVIDWADKHSAELIDGITETSREAINNAIAELQETGDWDEAYDEILAAVGDEARADLIARTETMLAANNGQRLAWDQAVDKGLLTGDERVVWIATDIGPCDECEELDGKKRDLDGEYPDPGGEGPPLHPNCRCTEGIA